MEPTLFALIGAVFAGAGVKLVEKLLGRKKEQVDLAADIREELRKDLAAVKSELQRVENELDDWKKKYYAQIEHMIELKTELERYTHQAKLNVDQVQEKVQELPGDTK